MLCLVKSQHKFCNMKIKKLLLYSTDVLTNFSLSSTAPRLCHQAVTGAKICHPSEASIGVECSVNPIIYIVIHRQTCFVLSELFSVTRQARLPKVRSKPRWLKRQSKILPLSHEETSASAGNLNTYVSQLFLFTLIRLTATESSIHMKSLTLL